MSTKPDTPLSTAEERERLRAQLQSRSVLLFVTLASIGDAVVTTDSDSLITFLNPVAEALTGWTLAEAVGMEVERVFPLVDGMTGRSLPDPSRQALSKVSKVGLPPDTLLVRKDGSRVPIDDSCSPILGVQNEPLGAIIVFRDITERKRTEQVIKYRSELDRMAARISTAFVTSPVTEVDARIDEALREIGTFFPADRAFVFLFDRTGPSMTCAHEWHAEGLEPMKGVTRPRSTTPFWTAALEDRRYVCVTSIEEIPLEAEAERRLWQQRGLQAYLAVPMYQEDRTLGFIGVESVREPRTWPEETINALSLVSDIFTGAMARRDAQRKLEAARAKEVEIGSTIQRTLLLSTPPSTSADFEIATLTIPSRGIDGDFYDFLLHPNRSLDVIFGDVMGKGVPAALLSAGAKTEFLRSLSHLLVSSPRGSIPRPQDIVNGVHSVLTPQLMNLDTFVTLTYARFEPKQETVTLVDCGNTRLMRCCADGSRVELLSGYNLPLGFSVSEAYSEAQFGYDLGDLFVLYSDGVTEARNHSGELFGNDRLLDLVAEKNALPARDIVEAVRTAVTSFVGSENLSDDLTCVAIRILPESAEVKTLAREEMQVTSSLAELATIRAFLRGFCERFGDCGLTEQELHLVELAVNEVASNIMRHAYRGRTDQHIHIRLESEPSVLRVRLMHDGEAFTGVEQIPLPSFEHEREGGFGLFIISRAVDEVNYGQDANGKQYVELTKRHAEAG